MRNFVKYGLFKTFGIGLFLMLLPAAQHIPSNQPVGSKSYFGVLLSTSSVSSDMIYAVFTENASGISHKFISRHEFVQIALGRWKVRPNIKQENLFDKYGIVWGIDEDTDELVVPILDSIWKVRYRQFPYIRGARGWANDEYMPSPAQQIYLADSFNVRNINTEFFKDEDFWKLLQSAQSEAWKGEYKSLFD
jgi:hypothetical protein